MVPLGPKIGTEISQSAVFGLSSKDLPSVLMGMYFVRPVLAYGMALCQCRGVLVNAYVHAKCWHKKTHIANARSEWD